MTAWSRLRALHVCTLSVLTALLPAVSPPRCVPIPVDPAALCPTAVITVEEGEEVVPGTVVHLRGAESRAADGRAVVAWHWSVEQSAASGAVFLPSAEVANPTIELDLVGRYTFSLDVQDDAGTWSCAAAEAEVIVCGEGGVHVELVWSTPGDPDENDTGPSAGSDLDLHVLHPDAPGDPEAPDVDGNGAPDPWFDQPFDCLWGNPRPDWGGDGPTDDDPYLDRNDTDGAGPELVHIDAPPAGVTYRLGVHSRDDHGFGPSTATVRVRRFGVLWVEIRRTLASKDRWFVGTFDPATGAFAPCDEQAEGPCLAPGYEHPLFGG